MTIANKRLLYKYFPKLKESGLNVTSPATTDYNCVAWAVNLPDRWWWPTGMFWPVSCPREVTISAFQAAFAACGYKPCNSGRLEKGYTKIALYAIGNEPTHVARQLRNGRWTSKLGASEDIEHRIADLEGPKYGKVAMYFRRRVS